MEGKRVSGAPLERGHFFSPQCHKINVFLRHCENAHWALLFLSQDVPEHCPFLGFSVNKKGSSCLCSYQRCLLSPFLEGYWEEVNEDERFYWGGIWRVADADGDPKDDSLMTLWLSFLNWVCRDAFLQKSIFSKLCIQHLSGPAFSRKSEVYLSWERK